jgi:hypothetical protein
MILLSDTISNQNKEKCTLKEEILKAMQHD